MENSMCPRPPIPMSLLIHEKPPEGGLSPSMTGFCPRFVLVLCLAYQHMEHGVGDESCKYGHKQVAQQS